MKRLVPFAAAILSAHFALGAPATAPANDDEAARDKALSLLSAGKQRDAERLIFARARENPTPENVFFAGVLTRSRFNVRRADAIFAQVEKASPDTLAGETARLVSLIDGRQDVEANFQALDQLSSAHPTNPLILWMVAVECRQLKKAKIGIDRYTQLLKLLAPGPALLHQTLGNLLLDDQQPAEALKHYDTAIQMEPASWDYNSRGLALKRLGRLDEAAAAYRKATELNPHDPLPWRNWAVLCDERNDVAGAIQKRAKAAEIAGE